MNGKGININLWDDYYDDDDVPVGKCQETFMYVEEWNVPAYTCKAVLDNLKGTMVERGYIPEGVTVQVRLRKFNRGRPPRWEIHFTNLTHKYREVLVKRLYGLELMGDKLNIYSES